MLEKKFLVLLCTVFLGVIVNAQMLPVDENSGKPTYPSPPFVEMILVSLAVISAAYYLLFVVNKKKRKAKAEVLKHKLKLAETRNNTTFEAASSKADSVVEGQKNLSEKIFQQFVFSRFPVEDFEVTGWRDDYYSEEPANRASALPGLELESRKGGQRFGVVSRWRHGFVNGKSEWATSHQLQGYREWEYRTQQHLFLVLGIGGKPVHPEKLFIIPLRRIESVTLDAAFAHKYLRSHLQRFTVSADGVFLE